MPRPLRLRYEGACYHVMNRGRRRHTVFHDADYCEAFLQSVQEACQRFSLEVFAYCLMGNHYHLFVRTPLANVDRCMRHINGTFTQRYNRLKVTDGPLFRGRYKSILVEADAYGLALSRYIHRNPIAMKKPLVMELADYPWSSYPAYLNQALPERWLNREFIYDLHGVHRRYQGYRGYVEGDTDDELKTFYGGKKQIAILGSKAFIDEMKLRKPERRSEIAKRQKEYPSIGMVIRAVAASESVSVGKITKAKRGRSSENVSRWMALYLARELTQETTRAIANQFGLGHTSGINYGASRLKERIKSDRQLKTRLKLLFDDLTP